MNLKPEAVSNEHHHLLKLYLGSYPVGQQFLPKAVKRYQDLRLYLNPLLVIHD